MTVASKVLAFASQRFPRASSRVLASSGYTLDLEAFGPDAFSVWGAEAAGRQDRAWRPIVAAARQGSPREDVAALFSAVDAMPRDASTILEVGCGGGYNSELIQFRSPRLQYTGVDIAASMIELARQYYPDGNFAEASAYSLPFETQSYDIVLDGVALIHMTEWRTALREYARVARGTVVLHGLTLAEAVPTTVFAKFAYGQPSREFVFNRIELLTELTQLGFGLDGVFGGLDYDLADYIGIPTVSETWVLRR